MAWLGASLHRPPDRQPGGWGTGRDGESQNLEWTCGCANTQGTVLVIGKNDRGGIISMKEPLRLLEDIPNTTRSLLGIVADVTIKSEEAGEYLEN